jgi:branched-chain amino acid transport system ATP-binding protein
MKRKITTEAASSSSRSPYVLEVDRINVAYGEAQALFDVSFAVEPRTVGALVGPNGAGKSTLLKSILGVVPVRDGSIRFQGDDVTRLSVPATVKRGITLVPEGRELFAGLTVSENLELGRVVSSRASDQGRDLLEWTYELFPVLKKRRGQLAGSLSGGEQQMAAIGRGLLGAPRLLMLDEPSLGLAPVMVERIVSGIARIIDELDMSVLIVEQNIGAAAALADQLIVMNVGRVVSELQAEGEDGFDMDALTSMYWGHHDG